MAYSMAVWELCTLGTYHPSHPIRPIHPIHPILSSTTFTMSHTHTSSFPTGTTPRLLLMFVGYGLLVGTLYSFETLLDTLLPALRCVWGCTCVRVYIKGICTETRTG